MPLPTIAGMVDPSNQQLNATRWTDKEPFASIPYLPAITDLFVGERKQIPPSEGVTPVQGIADPITNIAMLIAPYAKAALSRQAPLIDPTTRILSSQRGSASAEGGESTMDALRRMFLNRGGVESSEMTPLSTRGLSPREMAQQEQAFLRTVHTPKPPTDLDALFTLREQSPQYTYYMGKAEDLGATHSDILHSLNTPEIQSKVEAITRFRTQPTHEREKLFQFVKTHIDPDVTNLSDILDTKYIHTSGKGVVLGRDAMDKFIENTVRQYKK